MSYHTNKTTRKRIDKHLHEIAVINCNLGTDSTSSEIKRATKLIRDNERKIKAIDREYYKLVFEFD